MHAAQLPKRYKLRQASELLFWLLAFAFFMWQTPSTETSFSLCIFHHLGFENCLGCGIGRSIVFLLHGDWQASFNMHILGIPATLILAHRIAILSKQIFTKNQLN